MGNGITVQQLETITGRSNLSTGAVHNITVKGIKVGDSFEAAAKAYGFSNEDIIKTSDSDWNVSVFFSDSIIRFNRAWISACLRQLIRDHFAVEISYFPRFDADGNIRDSPRRV